jgi:hypothetical protein
MTIARAMRQRERSGGGSVTRPTFVSPDSRTAAIVFMTCPYGTD